jgi:WD40 repeat protein
VSRDELRQEAVACLGDFAGLPPSTFGDFPAGPLGATLHPSGRELALSLGDGSVSIRDLATGTERARLPAGDDRSPALYFLPSAALGPGGDWLVTGNRAGAIKVWERDAAGGWAWVRGFPTFPRLGALAITPDGQLLASCSEGDPHVTLWNLRDGTRAGRLRVPGEEKLAGGLVFSPDGTRCAGSFRRGDVWGVLLWDMATRQRVGEPILPDLAQVSSLAFGPEGRLLVLGCVAGVAVYDTSDLSRYLFVRGYWGASTAFSPDGRWLAFYSAQEDQVRLWSAVANHEVAALRSPRNVRFLGFGPGGPSLVAVGTDSATVWDLAGTGERRHFAGHQGGVPGLAFSPDGKLLASGSNDRTVCVWDVATGAVLKRIGGFVGSTVHDVAFSSDGQLLAASDWGGRVLLWRVGTWAELGSAFLEKGTQIWSTSFSPDGRSLGVCGEAGAVIFRIDVEAGPRTERVSLRELARPRGREAKIKCASGCFSPDGQLFAWVEPDNGGERVIHLWDLTTGRERPPFPGRAAHYVNSMAFLPDSRHLLIEGKSFDLEVWDVAEGRQVDVIGRGAFSTMQAGLTSGGWPHLTLGRDGRRIALGLRSEVSIGDLDRKSFPVALPAEQGAIWTLAWSPDGNTLAIGTSQGGPFVWDIPKVRAQLRTLGLDWEGLP